MPKPQIPTSGTPSNGVRSLRIETLPEMEGSVEVLQGVKRRRRRWSLLWAIAIHAALLIIGALLHVTPALIAQIGNSMTLSTEPAVDRQQESTEDKMVEEVVVQTNAAPPPKPTEAAIPEFVPVTRPVDLVMPEPVEATELAELQPDIVDISMAFGDGFEGEEPEDQPEPTKMFSAPAQGKCTLFVIDVSTSMPRELGNAGIDALRKDLRLAIDALPADQLFNLICFGDKADGFASSPVFATAEHKGLAHRFMVDYFTGKFTRTRTERFGRSGLAQGIPYVPIEPTDVLYMKKTSGGSRYDLALVAAFQQRASTVYLVTDGTPSVRRDRGLLPGSSSVSRDEVIRTVVQAGRRLYPKSGPLVNCVSINGIGERYLKQLAFAFGGQYRSISVQRNGQMMSRR